MTKLNQHIFQLLFSLQAVSTKTHLPSLLCCICVCEQAWVCASGICRWACVCACVKSACCRSNLRRRHSNQVLLHMFLVSAPRFPQRAGRLIVSLVIGGPGKGHDQQLARAAANMAGFLFHLPLKLNQLRAKINCRIISPASLTATCVSCQKCPSISCH